MALHINLIPSPFVCLISPYSYFKTQTTPLQEYSLTCLPPSHPFLSLPLCSPITWGHLHISSSFIIQSSASSQKTMNTLRAGVVPHWFRIHRARVLSTASFQCLWAAHGRLQNVSTQKMCIHRQGGCRDIGVFWLDGGYSLNWLPNR